MCSAQPSPLLSRLISAQPSAGPSCVQQWPGHKEIQSDPRTRLHLHQLCHGGQCPVRRAADNLPVMASKTRHTPDQRWPALDIKTFTYLILTQSWGHCVTLSCNVGRDVWEINTGAWKLDSGSCFSLQPAAVASSSFYIMIMGPSACESFHRVLIVSLKALVA